MLYPGERLLAEVSLNKPGSVLRVVPGSASASEGFTLALPPSAFPLCFVWSCLLGASTQQLLCWWWLRCGWSFSRLNGPPKRPGSCNRRVQLDIDSSTCMIPISENGKNCKTFKPLPYVGSLDASALKLEECLQNQEAKCSFFDFVHTSCDFRLSVRSSSKRWISLNSIGQMKIVDDFVRGSSVVRNWSHVRASSPPWRVFAFHTLLSYKITGW